MNTESANDPRYYRHLRLPIARAVERGEHHVLDVGCGEGVLGMWLRENGRASYVEGVELCAPAAEAATGRLHHVVNCDLNKISERELLQTLHAQEFDYIICADVLEHLIDPWAWTNFFAGLLRPGGTMIISIPNVRSYKVIFPLLFLGRFEYQDSGPLDRTHLRFFTQQTARKMMQDAGLDVGSVTPIGKKLDALINAISLKLLKGLLANQWLLVGHKK